MATPNVFIATYPVGADIRDVLVTSTANLPTPPDFGPIIVDPSTIQVGYNVAPSPAQITAWQTAVAATTPSPTSPWRVELTLLTNALSAIQNNVTFLAIPSPTQAQALAQVQALTRQIDAIIRVFLGAYDSTSGT